MQSKILMFIKLYKLKNVKIKIIITYVSKLILTINKQQKS